MEKEELPENWSEAVEDLVAQGDTKAAISLLETLISSHQSSLQLPSLLTDLAKLYSSQGFSLKSDDLLSRASILKLQAAASTHISQYSSYFVLFNFKIRVLEFWRCLAELDWLTLN